MPLRCTWDQVAAFRLRRQHLAAPGEDPVAVADRLVGVHAQIASSAELSLGARVPGLTPNDVRAGVAERRTLVKAWGLRKTLHLFAPAELPLVLAALRTSSLYRDAHLKPAWLRYHKVTLEEMQAIDAHVGEALDGRALTRDELASQLERITGSGAVGEAVRSGWGAVLKPAAFRGELCFGPDRGRNVTFVRPDQWLSPWVEPEPGAAAEELVRRGLRAHGPMALDDLRRWWGVQPADARRVLERLGGEVVEVDVEGWEGLALAADADELARREPPGGVHLLPMFDAYTIAATRHVEPLLAPGGARDAIYRPQGWVSAVVVVDGRFGGTWTRKDDRIEVQPFGRLPRKAVEAEIERIQAFR
jgi:Winged helix DNA-binding domain